MIGKVEKYIHERCEKDGVVFFGLIDPSKKENSIRYGNAFYEAGADLLVIGGSLEVDQRTIDEVVLNLKEKINIPIILFPGNLNGISRHADALYFMSLMNSSNPYWIAGVQMLSAPIIKKLGIEAIPTSLLVIEPGESVGFIGEAKPLPIHKSDLVTAYALAGKYGGHRVTILERGSGAPGPATPEIFRCVKKAVGHLVISAGSCKTYKDIKMVIKAGADGLHIASLIEKSKRPEEKAKKLVRFVKKQAKRILVSSKEESAEEVF